MIHFFKGVPWAIHEPSLTASLGHLEISVMEILWSRGRSSVRDVACNLDRKLAYTTVMTTLDRLFKKGLLQRQKSDRAYLYSPALSQQEWQQRRADAFVNNFLTGPRKSRQLLISCLLDAVVQQDAVVLEELEQKIQSKREELLRCDRP
jgi:predicted transcriptional regulator